MPTLGLWLTVENLQMRKRAPLAVCRGMTKGASSLTLSGFAVGVLGVGTTITSGLMGSGGGGGGVRSTNHHMAAAATSSTTSAAAAAMMISFFFLLGGGVSSAT